MIETLVVVPLALIMVMLLGIWNVLLQILHALKGRHDR